MTKDVPTRRELTTLIGDLSRRATGSGWDLHASTAAFCLMWFGGTWGRLDAADASDELDRLREVATALGEWPVPAASSNPQGESEMEFRAYHDFRDTRRLLEGHGLVVVNGTHLHTLADADGEYSVCGLRLGDAQQVSRLSKPPRTAGVPWCALCAAEVQRDVADTLDWRLLDRDS